MKKLFFTTILAVFSLASFAQDMIVKKDGSIIQAKVIKIGTSEVEYKKWSNQKGPMYAIAKSEILAITYQNGEKENFVDITEDETKTSNNSSQQYHAGVPATNNQSLISRHNSPVQFGMETKKKDAWWSFHIMAMSDSSLISTNDIEVRIVPTMVNVLSQYPAILHSIEIHNKTNSILYIDLANTFKIINEGLSMSYYDTEQTTINHGKSNGVGVNLGGVAGVLGVGGTLGILANSVSVGGAVQNSVSKTYSSQRILTIPPHSKKNLTEYKEVQVKKDDYITISDIEEYSFSQNILKGKLKENGYLHYTESESPYNVKYYITYSTSQDFSKYSYLNFKLYARYFVGGDNRGFLITKQNKLLELTQKYINNYKLDAGIIMGISTPIEK